MGMTLTEDRRQHYIDNLIRIAKSYAENKPQDHVLEASFEVVIDILILEVLYSAENDDANSTD